MHVVASQLTQTSCELLLDDTVHDAGVSMPREKRQVIILHSLHERRQNVNLIIRPFPQLLEVTVGNDKMFTYILLAGECSSSLLSCGVERKKTVDRK